MNIPLNKVLLGALPLVFIAPGSALPVPSSITIQQSCMPPKVGTGTLNFGSVAVGGKRGSKSVGTKNTDICKEPFEVIASISGADEGDFSHTSNCPSELRYDEGCAISVIFSPKAKGSRTAKLTVAVRGRTGTNSYPIKLEGVGTLKK
jgi:hypothetical protein